jgi:transcriptional regulator with XRE-family HTH domain
MDNHTPQINGALLRLRREELGWTLADLATRACLSNKQVKQIEEGGTSSFYSDIVKMTAAKKIGGILGLPEQSVFVVEESEVLTEEVAAGPVDAVSHTSDEVHADASASASDKPSSEVSGATGHETDAAPKDIASPAVKPYLKSPSLETTVIQKSTNSALDSEDKPKSKNSLWYIIALFVAALGLAAVMQQPASTPVAEPPPPIQVLPSEQPDPAASAPSDAASSVAPAAPSAVPAASSAQSTLTNSPATAPASPAPVVRPAVTFSPSTSSSTPAASVGSVPTVSPATQVAPAAPSASKPQ